MCPCRGSLPNIAGMFGQLRVFNITRNLLTGSIPNTFGGAGIFTLVRNRLLHPWSALLWSCHMPICACELPHRPDCEAISCGAQL